ncbi:diaminopimelate decarboxylase family protein [candidate division CSSED10-310 bacterium]|uniref:Diaminopimelate decarboxylase family protein n=1 Tax=candidate division CSSED10-310 bacterium TaxID=2855610 RepID=A0ABV6Z0G6_UNCC1
MTKKIKQLDDCLSIRDEHLFIEECDTVDLVQKFGSPIFVYSENQVRRNIKRFQDSFEKGWATGPVKIMPAAKANWIPAVQRIIADQGCGCDIYSAGELSVALKAGFNPEFISVNGVPKSEEHIYRSIKEGVRLTIDSIEEVDVIEKAAHELQRVAKVRLRLKPVLSGFIKQSDFVAEGLVPTDLAAIAYKGGLTFEQILSVAPRMMQMQNVELVGFHEHHGRHDPTVKYWIEQMKSYAQEIGKVCQALGGYQPREIDIGGGFAVPRDPFNAVTDYSEPLQLAALYSISKSMNLLGSDKRYKVMAKLIDALLITHPNQIPAPTIEAYAEACTGTLQRELPRQGINTEGLMLQVEPGRSLHGNAGIHLTSVCNIKRITNPIRWNIVIVDTTEFWFTGGRYEHHLHDYLFANKANAKMVDKADIIGRSCYGDRLMPTVPIPEVMIGDILAFFDTGAYQEVSMSNFNALPRPATVLVTDDETAIIRRGETEEDVFRRDIIPDHLLPK